MDSPMLSPNSGRNVYAGQAHRIRAGTVVHGVSRSWARTVAEALEEILDASPDLRHVAIRVPKADRDVLRLFHSEDGTNWRQVDLPSLTGLRRDDGPHAPNAGWTPSAGPAFPRMCRPAPRRLNIRAIVRGAQELDGDPAFSSELSLLNLRLREQVDGILNSQDRRRPPGAVPIRHASMADWVETRARALRDAVAEDYIAGGGSEEAQRGRLMSVVAIERLIDRLRAALQIDTPFEAELDDESWDAQLQGALEDHFIRRRYPFATSTTAFRLHLPSLTKARRKEVVRSLWADAAGLPHGTRFDRVYGALLRAAEGHPIFGDRDYRRLEALLADALTNGTHVVRAGGVVFIRISDRWRAVRVEPGPTGEATWTEGEIISRNHGRVVVPPHRRDGVLTPGYTRNGPGEGPSKARPAAVRMRCVEKPLSGTDLAWLHAYHAWELGQA